MAEHLLDVANFRLLFPQFTSPSVFPDARIQATWDMAGTFLPLYDGAILCGPTLQSALNLMTAHLLALAVIAAAQASGTGAGAGIVTAASIDKVSVTLAAPTSNSAWAYWLNLTPYGVMLLALLRKATGGGFYLGGSPVRAGFRGPFG